MQDRLTQSIADHRAEVTQIKKDGEAAINKAEIDAATALGENTDLQRRMAALSAPDFSIAIDRAVIGDDRPGSSHIILYATLANSGAPAAVISSSWKFDIEMTDGQHLAARPTTIVEPESFCLDGASAVVFERGDQLSLRASNSIPRMGYVDGILSLVVLGLTKDQILRSPPIVTISIDDAARKNYSFSVNIADIIKLNGTVYRPSFSHPFPEPGCPSNLGKNK